MSDMRKLMDVMQESSDYDKHRGSGNGEFEYTLEDYDWDWEGSGVDPNLPEDEWEDLPDSRDIIVVIDYYNPGSPGSWDEPPDPGDFEFSAFDKETGMSLDKDPNVNNSVDDIIEYGDKWIQGEIEDAKADRAISDYEDRMGRY